jgi:hypothetical protein
LADWLRSLFGRPKARVINLPYSVPQAPAHQVAAPRGNRSGAELKARSFAESTTEAVRRVDRSAVLQAFDASRPISGRGQLFGRQREIESLLLSVFDYHHHAVVYGARGSGKTSVARVFGDFADQCGALVLYFPCEPEANFSLLMGAVLDGLPAGAIAAHERSEFARKLEAFPAHFGPLAFVDLVAQSVVRPVVLILDEFDRITDEQTKTDLAVAMKLLSDTHSSIRIMLVGIASSVSDILTAHPSLRRHISVVRIGRIEPTSVNALIDHGASASGIPFTDDARAFIERVCAGSPYHIRLFCRQAALKAIFDRKPEVDVAAVSAGLAQAFEQWAGTSPSDADRFHNLSLDFNSHDALEQVAQEAARSDYVQLNAHNAAILASLGDSIVPSSPERDRFVFADSLAPQFLIASILLAQGKASGSRVSGGWVNAATR